MVAGALTASAQWVIDTTDTQSLMTFDDDVDGVFMANKGTDTGWNVVEPDNWVRSVHNSGGGNALFSESVATSHRWMNGDGTTNGSATHFSTDGNANGATGDAIGYNQMTTRTGAGAVGNHSYGLSGKANGTDDHGVNGLYFRIQNNTGVTITDWTFDAKFYFGETNVNQFSILEYSYSIDDGTNPNTNYMSFISFGITPTVSQGDSITNLAGILSETVETAGVTNGGYIVLQFADTQDVGASSFVYIDDIGVTAVNPAPTGALISIN